MPIIKNVSRQVFQLPSLKHQTLASAAGGLGKLEMWMQTLELGAAAPVSLPRVRGGPGRVERRRLAFD